MKNLRLDILILLVSSRVAPQVESAACAAGIITLEISSSSDLENLHSVLDCTGGGVFDVSWYGTVAVNDTLYVPDGSDLTVTGFSSRSTLDEGSNPTATIDGGHRTPFGFFCLYNNSALTLNNLVLDGGYSTSNGGAVGALEEDLDPGPIARFVNIVDCTLHNNTAESFGEGFVARSSCSFRVRQFVREEKL